MKILHLTLAVITATFLTTALQAADAKLLVGKWEAVKVEEGSLPKGAVVEFTADGKMKMSAKKGDEELKREGTYTLEGDTISITIKNADGEEKHKVTIKKLTANEMEATNEKDKSATFNRVK